MSSTPLVSCVVIGRNEGDGLLRAVLSAQRAIQVAACHGEIICVDSASTDGSLEPVRALHDVKIIRLDDAHMGAAHARNVGASNARGEYLQFVDGDMELDPLWLDRALDGIQKSGWSAVTGHILERNRRGSVYNLAFGLDWPRGEGSTTALGGCCLWRRSAFRALGGFHTDLRVGEDPDLALRARKTNHVLWQLDVPMTSHDLAIGSLRQYLRRACSVGESLANVASRHPESSDVQARLRKTLGWAMALVALVPVAVFGSHEVRLVALLLLLSILFRRALLNRLAGLSFGHAVVHAIHVYVVKLPVAWGALSRFVAIRAVRRAA